MYLPIWSRDGNKVIAEWDEDFTCRGTGKRAIIHKVRYRDKKNNEHEAVHYVKWLES